MCVLVFYVGGFFLDDFGMVNYLMMLMLGCMMCEFFVKIKNYGLCNLCIVEIYVVLCLYGLIGMVGKVLE